MAVIQSPIQKQIMLTGSPTLNIYSWRKMFDIVVKIEKSPEIKADSTAPAKDVKHYQIRTKLALSIINLNIEPDFRKIIENCDSSVEA